MLNHNSVLTFADGDADFITGQLGLLIALEPDAVPVTPSTSRRRHRGWVGPVKPPVEFVPQKPRVLTITPQQAVDEEDEELLVLLGVL